MSFAMERPAFDKRQLRSPRIFKGEICDASANKKAGESIQIGDQIVIRLFVYRDNVLGWVLRPR
jgi:hypothetical protein